MLLMLIAHVPITNAIDGNSTCCYLAISAWCRNISFRLLACYRLFQMTSHRYIIAHVLGAWLAKPALNSTLLSAAMRNGTISNVAYENERSLSLKETAKSRYRLKLQLLGISLENHPYISGNVNFQDDMTAWPPVEYSHIFRYFIRRPSVYTQEQLLSWK